MTWSTVHAANTRTRIGVETTLATATSNWIDLVLRGPAHPLGKATRKMLERRDARRYRRDIQAPVKGLEAGSPVEFMVDAKRVVTRLAAGASPVAYTDAAALSHQLVLRAGLGGELTPQQGGVTTGTPTTTSIPLVSGGGARFVAGQICLISGAPRRVTAIATDTLTVYPALAGAPAASVAVLNAYNYFPGETDTLSLSVRHAFVEGVTADAQQQALGVHGSLEITFTVGEIIQYAYKAEALTVSAPGDLGETLDSTADDMGAPMVWEPVIYLQSAGTAPSVVQISEMKVSVPRKWQRVPGPGTEGVSAIVEVASHDEPITVEISGHMGTAEWAAFTDGTARWMLAYTQDGSGTDQRTTGVYFPRLVHAAPPTGEINGSLVFFRATLRALFATDIDSTPTPGTTAEISVAPMIFFNG